MYTKEVVKVFESVIKGYYDGFYRILKEIGQSEKASNQGLAC